MSAEADAIIASSSVVVVVAKCPIPGSSKTRLHKLLGEKGAAKLAGAMLSDVLTTISQVTRTNAVSENSNNNDTTDSTSTIISTTKQNRVLLYAPSTPEGRSLMLAVVKKLGIENDWTLLPMQDSSSQEEGNSSKESSPVPLPLHSLHSSYLGNILSDALFRAHRMSMAIKENGKQRRTQADGSVLFLGMDAPELPLEEIEEAFFSSSYSTKIGVPTAMLCPADDGGYGFLSVPCSALNDDINDAMIKSRCQKIFSNIPWSCGLTAVAQLKALTDLCVPVRIGRIMHDIDEPDDVKTLCQRLKRKTTAAIAESVLELSSTGLPARTGTCLYTRQALMDLGHF